MSYEQTSKQTDRQTNKDYYSSNTIFGCGEKKNLIIFEIFFVSSILVQNFPFTDDHVDKADFLLTKFKFFLTIYFFKFQKGFYKR